MIEASVYFPSMYLFRNSIVKFILRICIDFLKRSRCAINFRYVGIISQNISLQISEYTDFRMKRKQEYVLINNRIPHVTVQKLSFPVEKHILNSFRSRMMIGLSINYRIFLLYSIRIAPIWNIVVQTKLSKNSRIIFIIIGV